MKYFLKMNSQVISQLLSYCNTDQANIAPDHPIAKSARRPSGDTSSIAALNHIKSWISDCVGAHKACPGSDTTPPLPTRVIQIDGNHTNPHARLIETSGLQGIYACLSHCWGGSRAECITYKATLEANKAGIAWDKVPNTFQEAIRVASFLGISYLWIDSLCIIQDDVEDWMIEAAQMARIYQNAFITIAATAARSSYAGLFRHTPDEFIASSVSSATNGIPIFVRKALPHPRWDSTVEQEQYPLLDRAWVYQERLLSPRVIHFTETELVWECRESERCECQVGNAPSNDLAGDLDLAHVKMSWQDPKMWSNIVMHYSHLSLTFGKDKLPALAGAAREVANQQGSKLGTYLAGCWEHTLLIDLSWAIATFDAPGRSDPWRAPTWSWMSVDCAIHPGMFPCTEITIIEASCEPSGRDPYGQISSGHIVLRGCLLQTQLLYPSSESEAYRCFPFEIHDDELQLLKIKRIGLFPDYDITQPGRWQIPHQAMLSVLKLGHVVKGTHRCLVLRRLDTVEETYERVGYANLGVREVSDWYEGVQPSTLRMV